MLSLDHIDAIATGLPSVTEQDHHGMVSYRVKGKIFATVPDERHLRVMLDADGIRDAVANNPGTCKEFYWGKRLACAVLDLDGAEVDLVRALLTDAWLGKAPASLVRSCGLAEEI
ncbi:MAG: MmcQ/YjbR family DNA-binding protein [Acidimicrobiales bacterium]